MSKIRIYFAGIRKDERPIDLACALGVGGFPPLHGAPRPEYGKYDKLNRQAHALFESVAIDQAEIVIYCYQTVNTPEVLEVSRAAETRDLPCLFFSWGDVDIPVSVPHGTVYRHSLFTNTRLPNELAWPPFCSDPLKGINANFYARPRQEMASVGFCGYVSTPWKRLAYSLLGKREKALGLILRAQAMRALSASGKVKTQFIRRSAFWGGTFGSVQPDTTRHHHVRQQFLDNLMGSDYTLCIRGAGNFSYRFYETIAAGRIPLFINTRCVLPFEQEIDWRKHCVWVEEEDLDRAGEILANYHAGLTPEKFTEIQASNRQIWQERLCPLGFYKRILFAAVGKPNPAVVEAV